MWGGPETNVKCETTAGRQEADSQVLPRGGWQRPETVVVVKATFVAPGEQTGQCPRRPGWLIQHRLSVMHTGGPGGASTVQLLTEWNQEEPELEKCGGSGSVGSLSAGATSGHCHHPGHLPLL